MRIASPSLSIVFRDYGEIREISIGTIESVVIVTVTHTEREGIIRIISAKNCNSKRKKRIRMNISAKRLKEIESIPDEDIDTSDIPELDEHFWEKAKLIKPITKQAISLRIDNDVLEWFKNQGKGYQSLMNAVLRSYFEHQNKIRNNE